MSAPDAVGEADLRGHAPRFTIYLQASGGRVTQARFQTFGCGYSIAACSALTELITGKTISECQAITADQVVTALDGMPEEKRFCADLAVAALRDALQKLRVES
jgi:NifU-like protein involved in Fe-S cluster formation